jgi:hypothetical protein
VKSLLNNARESLTSGCTSDGWEMLNQALMLDPSSADARDLQDEMLIKELSTRCHEGGAEPCDTPPSTDKDPSPYPPGDGYDPEGPPDQCFDSGSVGKNHQLPAVASKLLERPVSGESEEQEGYFLIEVADDDLDLVVDNIAQCDEQAPADLKTQFRQLANILCENFGLDVDFGKSQPGCTRMAVQIGATEYFLTIDSKGQTLIQVKAVGPEGEGTSKKATEGDAEEAEEPLYPLETDLDPDW